MCSVVNLRTVEGYRRWDLTSTCAATSTLVRKLNTMSTLILTLLLLGSAHDNESIRDLFLTDPRVDKQRIEADKDRLLDGSCSWILETPSFIKWWRDEAFNLLWLCGDPGKGKTMMAIAIINEISKRLNCCPNSGILSYFFCQSTLPNLNNAVAIVWGLIYQLVDQERLLKTILQERLAEVVRSRLFEGKNALFEAFEILEKLLQACNQPRVYLIIDALDECDHELHRFLYLAFRSRNSKVKWFMTSRKAEYIVKDFLDKSHLCVDLEENSKHVLQAVGTFIDFKVSSLAKRNKYSVEVQNSVKELLSEKAEGTYLWVALVCKDLKNVAGWMAVKVLADTPAGLEEIYDRMLNKLGASKPEERVLYEKIICTAVLAFRPLHLRELQTLIDFPEAEEADVESFQTSVEACESFIIIRDGIAYFVHQTANEYFTHGKGYNIFSSSGSYSHKLLARRCIIVMNDLLTRNMCGITNLGVNASDLNREEVADKLMLLQYPCLYIFRHLSIKDDLDDRYIELDDGEYIDSFLRTKFLYWLEALSLLRIASKGIMYLIELIPLISVSS